MITLDHIKQLDRKVHKAIDEINTLRAENKMLLEDLDKYQLRIEELEIMINAFKEDQSEIETGIIEALNQLDILEDTIAVTSTDTEQVQQNNNNDPELTSEKAESDSSNTGQPEGSAEEEKIPTPEEPAEEGESELDIF